MDAATDKHGTIPQTEQVVTLVARIQADAMLEAAKIASEYHTFGGVHQGLLRRAKELQEGK